MKKELIIFGAGCRGKRTYEKLKDNYHILCFADNNPDLLGKKLYDCSIISGESIVNYCMDEVDVVVSTLHYPEICEQLNKMGISSCYIMYDEICYYYDMNPSSNIVRRCSRCVMDSSSDRWILFDEKGRCNYCSSALQDMESIYFPNKEGKNRLHNLLVKVKSYGKGKKYDCIMGLSGGLDSSYLTYLAYKWGIHSLIVHIDDGYDTEVAKSNINKLIEATKFDYEIIRPDKKQYNDLTLSYMKAGVPNIAVPQDNILFAFLYKMMRAYDIKYFLSGWNFSMESILQRGNTHNPWDLINIMDIQKKFGKEQIDKLEFISFKQRKHDRETLKIETLYPLNYIEYKRNSALQELNSFCGFEYYGRKHLENKLTAFAQLYWFPKKFHVDKRTSHLSSMIVSNQLSREDALKQLEEPIYDENQMQEYISLIKKNMGITDKEFERIMEAPTHRHEEYEIGSEFF